MIVAPGSIKRGKEGIGQRYFTSLLFRFSGTEGIANALRENRFVKFIALLTDCRYRSAAKTKARSGTKVERQFEHFCRAAYDTDGKQFEISFMAVEREIQYIDLQFPTDFINSLQLILLRPRVFSSEEPPQFLRKKANINCPRIYKKGKVVLDVTSRRFMFSGTEATANALRERRFVKFITFLTDCRYRFSGTEAPANALRVRRFVKFIAFLTDCRYSSVLPLVYLGAPIHHIGVYNKPYGPFGIMNEAINGAHLHLCSADEHISSVSLRELISISASFPVAYW
ncbi:hypothetical protein CDAR_402801 [Caerostris darwini]|uniref:Maturase n=1 Tax=Caerostris darwini TaxID=1538125 RepID=A0AAV4N251_9ARAC|nr:hypothetical protein CDAR_402801 [Caerostris darwini]